MGTKSGHSSRRVFVILMLAAVILCMLLLHGARPIEGGTDMGELLLPVALGGRDHRSRCPEHEGEYLFAASVPPQAGDRGRPDPLRTEGWPGIHHPRRRGHTQGMLPVCRGENGQPRTGYGRDGRPDHRSGYRIGTDLLRDD